MEKGEGEMKRCSKCKLEKEPGEFYKSAAQKDGLSGYCKVCQKAYAARYEQLPKTRAARLSYGRLPRVKAAAKRYRESPKGKALRARYEQTPEFKATAHRYRTSAKGRATHARGIRAYRLRHPERVEARNIAMRALNKGPLKRKPCETCGVIKVEMHHDHYSQPLDVRWFCAPCHGVMRR